MKTDSLIRLLAGTVVLAGTALAHFVSPWSVSYTHLTLPTILRV